MSELCADATLAIAFAHTAEVTSWNARLTRDEREPIERLLHSLCDLGHVATFSIEDRIEVSAKDIVDRLRSRIGPITVDACLGDKATSRNSARPAFLMPVWPFDQTGDGLAVATGQMLSLAVELVAVPSPDEEVGACLPDRTGRWMIHARPLF